MTETFHCDDKEQLVAYLYDELDGAVRRGVEEHLRLCAACADDVAGLSGVRHELAGWGPPTAHLGFTVMPAAAQAPAATRQVIRPPRWSASAVPVWARAAAAVLVVSAGLAVANIQVRYGADGLLLTTGWMSPAVPPASASGEAATVAVPGADWRPALSALESTLRQEIQAVRASAPPTSASAARGNEVPLRRVAELIEQSERRQQQQLALRLTQFNRDLEVQRRSDLVRINQGFGQFEGRAGAEIARQRQMLDYIMRVSAQPPPQ